MLEQGLERKIKKLVNKKGGLFLKWVSPGFTGVPDRIMILPGGQIVFVEIKRPGLTDGMSQRQKRVKSQLEELGCQVIRASCTEDVEEVINEICAL